MKNQSVLLIGVLMITAGGFFLLGSILQFDPWLYFWPLAIIALGIWFIFRPQTASSNFQLIGDINRSGAWQVGAEQFTTFVGDFDLDFTQALIPPGETTITCSGFVGDFTMIIPAGVGVKTTCAAFVTEMKFLGEKSTNFLTVFTHVSPGYETAGQKLHLITRYFVGDIKVKQG